MTLTPKNQGELEEGLMILFGLCLVLFIFILPNHAPGPLQTLPSLSTEGGSTITQGSTSHNPNTSSYSNSISVGSGNSSYEYQPLDEYVTIENNGSTPINITGWKLRNGKDLRGYQVGSEVKRYSADVVTIPKAAKFVSPTGNNLFQDVILGQYDRAVITTGTSGVNSPYPIVNFRENKCSGYIEALPTYHFVPELQFSCPQPTQEPGFNSLDTRCQDFISSRFNSCHTPVYGGVNPDKSPCRNCIDGQENLTTMCSQFIKTHYDYPSCIANHQNDPDFSLPVYRIFLGNTWELWAQNHESIFLLDASGQQVYTRSY